VNIGTIKKKQARKNLNLKSFYKNELLNKPPKKTNITTNDDCPTNFVHYTVTLSTNTMVKFVSVL